MTNEIKNAYEQYCVLGEQISKLQAARKEAQSVIKGFHKSSGQQLILEDGFKSQIIEQTVNTLDKSKLIAKFGAEAIADCYTTTKKENFRCEKLICG